MSINWVMLSDTDGFIRLPGERILYTSPPRTTLSLQSSTFHSGTSPVAVSSNAGVAFLTNQRIVYLPSLPVLEFRSFSAPILSLHDTHVTAPFFGPNVWRAALQPVSGGGIPSGNTPVELKMTFKEGGAFDFHSHFERINEQLRQAVDVARENGYTGVGSSNADGGRGAGPLSGVDMAAIHLEQLPAYEEARTSGSTVLATPVMSIMASDPEQQDMERLVNIGNEASDIEASWQTSSVPLEPPPGYEEVQRSTVASQLESRIRVE